MLPAEGLVAKQGMFGNAAECLGGLGIGPNRDVTESQLVPNKEEPLVWYAQRQRFRVSEPAGYFLAEEQRVGQLFLHTAKTGLFGDQSPCPFELVVQCAAEPIHLTIHLTRSTINEIFSLLLADHVLIL